ncbi:hypothetical protein BGZ46_003658, partial [Entomortierella lignicola]
MACDLLEALKIDVDLGVMDDHVESISALWSLKRLEVRINSPELVEFLRFNIPAGTQSLPALEALTVSYQPAGQVNSESLDTAASSILRNRANLKTFCVGGELCSPQIFGDIPWVCNNLESLSISLFWIPSTIDTQETKSQQWAIVYKQIGSLTHLKKLSIESSHFE